MDGSIVDINSNYFLKFVTKTASLHTYGGCIIIKHLTDVVDNASKVMISLLSLIITTFNKFLQNQQTITKEAGH